MKNKPFKPSLLDLDPKSSARVFLVVNSFTNLDGKYIKGEKDLKIIISHSNYSNVEKYFILYYVREHLKNRNNRSFRTRQFNQRRNTAKNDYSGEIEDLEDLETWFISIDAIFNNTLKVCETYLPEALRLYANSMSNKELPYDEFEGMFEVTAFQSIKLPLVISTRDKTGKKIEKNLEPEIIEKLKAASLTQKDIDAILKNSFNIKHQNPPQLLNLDYKNLGKLRSVFYEIYSLYKEEIDNFKNYANSEIKNYNDKKSTNKLTSAELVRELFKLPEEDLYNKLTNKIYFAEIIFISFIQLRKKFLQKALKSNILIKSYITENICKNMKA